MYLYKNNDAINDSVSKSLTNIEVLPGPPQNDPLGLKSAAQLLEDMVKTCELKNSYRMT